MSESAATCGLLCQACSLFIATQEDPERLQHIATKFGISKEEASCFGCRSEKRFGPCSICRFSACAKGKELAFCSECESFPCKELTDFQGSMPHRLDLWEDLEEARLLPVKEWIEGMRLKYACKRCGTINSAYDLSCRKCGQVPSCDFVERHMEAIRKHLRLE